MSRFPWGNRQKNRNRGRLKNDPDGLTKEAAPLLFIMKTSAAPTDEDAAPTDEAKIQELKQAPLFDVTIVNDDLQRAVDEARHVIEKFLKCNDSLTY